MAIRTVADFGQKSAQEIERAMEVLQPGWYRATISDVSEDNSNIKIHFDLDGRALTETLWDPESGKDTKTAERLGNRRNLFLIRLGIIPRDAKGQVFEVDWEDLIGKECILELDWGRPDKETQKKYANLTWAGIYAADDPRALEKLPAESGASLAAPAAATTSSAPPSAPPPPAASPVNRIAGAVGRGAGDINLDDL